MRGVVHRWLLIAALLDHFLDQLDQPRGSDIFLADELRGAKLDGLGGDILVSGSRHQNRRRETVDLAVAREPIEASLVRAELVVEDQDIVNGPVEIAAWGALLLRIVLGNFHIGHAFGYHPSREGHEFPGIIDNDDLHVSADPRLGFAVSLAMFLGLLVVSADKAGMYVDYEF